jgi:hypothetical protein
MSDQAQEINYDTMTDAEINNLPLDESPLEEHEPEVEVEAEVDVEQDVDVDEVEVEEEVDEDDVEEVDGEVAEVEVDEGEEEASDDSDDVETDNTDDDTETELGPFDGLEELLKEPLLVGNTKITINSAEELVTLAKRGLGANKRIQELAPQLKIMSMLESNGLMDQDKLNFLIALDKKDPAAIKQLVATSGIDAFDASTGEVDESYTPEDRSVTDDQFAVGEAFRGIQGTPTYNETLKSIDGFSENSKAEIRANPSLIGQLSEHHENGYYQEIQGIVLKEQAMGKLRGLDNLQAYKHVWNQIQENSASMGGGSEAGHKNTTNDQSSQENLARKGRNPEAGHKAKAGKRVGKAQQAAKKAAESTNKNRGSQKPTTVNFDDLTDEQIADLDVNDFFI